MDANANLRNVSQKIIDIHNFSSFIIYGNEERENGDRQVSGFMPWTDADEVDSQKLELYMFVRTIPTSRKQSSSWPDSDVFNENDDSFQELLVE